MSRMIALSSLLAVLALAASPAVAQIAPSNYCLKADFGGTNCGFATFEQCEQSKTGNADICTAR
jgi:hypothetical protein